jgi:hypothetical protein
MPADPFKAGTGGQVVHYRSASVAGLHGIPNAPANFKRGSVKERGRREPARAVNASVFQWLGQLPPFFHKLRSSGRKAGHRIFLLFFTKDEKIMTDIEPFPKN